MGFVLAKSKHCELFMSRVDEGFFFIENCFLKHLTVDHCLSCTGDNPYDDFQ